MVTRAIKTKRDEDRPGAAWQTLPETAPSVMIKAQPTVARFLAMVGLLLVAIGGLSLLTLVWKFQYMVPPAWGVVALTFGMFLILMHALVDADEQIRRMYGFVGLFLLVIAAGSRLIAGDKVFLTLGLPTAAYSLLLLGAVMRHETEPFWRSFLSKTLLGSAILIVMSGIWMVSAFRGNNVNEGFLLMILGLFFWAVAINCLPEGLSFRSAVSLGVVGVFCMAECVVGTAVSGVEFLIPTGFILFLMGFVYVAICLGAVSDMPLIVLTRRELSSFIYSPVGYPVFIGLMLIGLYNFDEFVDRLTSRDTMFEPVVQYYMLNLIPVIAQMFLVPVLTMRLLSEEQRSGTMEVLLTAPVNEFPVVMSKFLAGLILFMLMWLPWWIYLVSLRVASDTGFDYRPLLTFGLALLSTGAGFIAMGLFFSAVTRNQIIAAVLTFVGMVAHLATFLIKRGFRIRMDSPWFEVLNYVSFLDLWISTLQGHLAPRYLVFHLSLAIFFLFLTLQVLESRKWK